MGMKGDVSPKAFYIVGAIIIGLMVLISAQNVMKQLLEREIYYETKLVQLGIRNNILFASALESGRIIYEPADGGTYRISLSNQFISAVQMDADTPNTEMAPVPIPHYTPNAVPKEITAGKFCIVKKTDSNCNALVEVCEANDAACCMPSVCQR